MELNLTIDQEISSLFPALQVGLLTGEVVNEKVNEDLFAEISKVSSKLEYVHSFETVREIPAIQSAKKAYRILGKDPNRYRISAEAMIRRIVKGQSLYQINAVVDSLNLVSIKTGVTIGGFDLQQVKAPLSMSVGKESEDFEAIGRGSLNIHRLPVYRDDAGAIGSPTSDCTRTRLRLETSRFLMIVTDFFGEDFIQPTLEELKKSLTCYAKGKNYQEKIV